MRPSPIVFVLGLVAGCTVQQNAPNIVGQDVRFTVIHTSDIHSRLFPYNFVPNKFDQAYGMDPNCAPFGGIARITAMVKDIRRNSQRSLWLDSGDAWQGAPVFNEFKGEAEVRALSLAGMEGEVLGNHEFDTGAANLFTQLDNWSQFPHLAANYEFFDPPQPGQRGLRDIISPFQIYEVQGLKIAVIGMANVDTLTSIAEGGNSLGFRGIQDAATIQRWVRVVRPLVDLVVISSHLGLDQDEGLTPSQVDDPNEKLPLTGIDLILGGHLHIVTNPPKILPNDDGSMYCKTHDCRTLLVHSGAFAKFVGKIDLVVHVGTNNADPETRSRIVSFAYKNEPVAMYSPNPATGQCNPKDHTHDVVNPEDADVAALMFPYGVKLNQDIDLKGVFSYIDAPAQAKLLRQDTTGGDSQLGNLVARSMQQQPGVEAEIAFTNSLGIRTDFEHGELTNEQMFNVFPFENTITVMYLSGQEIQDTFDFVARKSASRGCRTQAQVAGLAMDMVCHGTCTNLDPTTGELATACAKNIYVGDNCRGANSDGPIDPAVCAPLQATGLYRVAVNDYIAAGGSGFDVLKRNSSKQDTGISLRDALTVYLTRQPAKCDGVTTDMIPDDTDPLANPTAIPPILPRTVFQRYGKISCLDDKIEAHDGRIRPVYE